MKKQDRIFFRLTINDAAEIIVKQTHEIAATKAVNSNKLFSVADMWNIHRRRKLIQLR